MTPLRDRLLSDQNIFLAIYLANSWLQEQDLLNAHDYKLFQALQDIFDEKTISKVIQSVQKRIQKLLDDKESFFRINVFFKPKGEKNGETTFRPIHTAQLVDQIAMVAMLQVLVYEISNEGKLVPSELSRMLPSNFYGNRISYDGKHLFKPWQEQYHQYTTTANNLLIHFGQTGEYRYEISLDLQNYFPSIDPQVVFSFICSRLPLKWSRADELTAKTILRKLLFFELESLNAEEQKWYCGYVKNQSTDNALFAKGLPQGLPHTYFIANIFMLLVQEKYATVFPGEMLFYVDDSVIFTNGPLNNGDKMDQASFTEAIDKLNVKIREEEERLRNSDATDFLLPQHYCYCPQDFGVTLHNSDGKSMFSNIKDSTKNSGELYLQGLSRETSNMSFDLATIFSDEDVTVMYERTKSISEIIRIELDHMSDTDNVRREKLLRYKKFFSYRETILHFRISGNLEQLLAEILHKIEIRDNSSKLVLFWENYNDDILAATIPYLIKRLPNDKDKKKLLTAVKKLCNTLYKTHLSHSYLMRTCDRAQLFTCKSIDPYRSLIEQIHYNYCRLHKQVWKLKLRCFQTLLKENSDNLFIIFNYTMLKEWSIHVRLNSTEIERRILNAAFSYLFDYNVDDQFIFSKRSHNPILYSEIRILASLRIQDFSYPIFLRNFENFISDPYQCVADYSLLQVMGIFQSFVGNSTQIDQLICIHKYCCDTWKNGSKHLHFYTLHNQEHAVTLIKLAVRWMHTISFFNFKKNDYFILFAACYLHDISMVTLPDYTKFYMEKDVYSNQILSEIEEKLRAGDTIACQQALLQTYQDIDAYFEHVVRSHHAKDSANEIRNFKELDFIDTNTREFIARISEAHGDDTLNIYCTQAKGTSELINEKQLKILLRLSDLLDMARYRVSDVILKHNLSSLNTVSRFHWISHLITDGCNISAEYYPTENQLQIPPTEAVLKNGCITEKIVLTVDVLMSQTTPIKNSRQCPNVAKSELYNEEDGNTAIRLCCDEDHFCCNPRCNFLCKWFTLKNGYLLEELGQLKLYLSRLPERFFHTDIEIRIRVIADREIPNDIFDYLRDYVNQH